MTFMAVKMRVLAVLCLVIMCGAAWGAPSMPKALLISDIHFDPFHDPAKVGALLAAPVSGWERILAAPDSPTQAKDFAALKVTCKQKADDTSYTLLMSSLRAIQERAPDVRFVTMNGDMLAHELPCKFTAIVPAGTPAQYELLVEKTMEFQARMIERALPHATVYLSMGNNDSNCDDYKLSTNTAFLAKLGKVIGRGMGRAWNAKAAAEFTTGGYYSVIMAAPMQRTRLIVVNDIFLAPKYQSCLNKADDAPGKAQMEWLQQELDAARREHQRVWVMGHIPPGVNPYTTAKKSPLKICAPAGTDGAGPAMFMPNEILGETLVKNADVIELAIFGHTHADELRLLGSGDSEVALKIVPSITPYNGNNPAFTVAQVDPETATMADYTVFAAADAAGSVWSKEYTFSEIYGHTGFTPVTLRAITDSFFADGAQKTAASQAYLRYYEVGEPVGALPAPVWHAAVCALTKEHSAEFAACACALQ